jgi:hypothetical protein
MLIGRVYFRAESPRNKASESPLSDNSGTFGECLFDERNGLVDRGETRAADYATRRTSMSDSIAALFQRLTQGVYVVGVAHGEPP